MNKQKDIDALTGVFEEIAKSGKSGNLESVKASNLENEKLVNLGVKIPAAHRNFWNSKAALEGSTMKSVIVAALEQKFGKPE